MIYTGIYDAKLIYEEAQEALLPAGRLPLNVAAQAQAIRAVSQMPSPQRAPTALPGPMLRIPLHRSVRVRIERCRQPYRFRAIRILYTPESSGAR